jgi:lipopolysaccharide transport system permease protein
MLALPLFLFLAIVMALAVGLWFSALNVKYRDFRYVVPFIVQFGLYISPVGFNSSVVPEKWRMIYSLNPMVGVIDGFRWSIIGEGSGIFAPGLVVSVLMTTIIFASGLWFFLKTEKTFADII